MLGTIVDPKLRGYRALWHYLAGSSEGLAVADGDEALEGAVRAQFRMAKDAPSGITWLVGLARGNGAASTPEDQAQATVLLQVERLEAHLHKLGTVHNRRFSAKEREIREGLVTHDRCPDCASAVVRPVPVRSPAVG